MRDVESSTDALPFRVLRHLASQRRMPSPPDGPETAERSPDAEYTTSDPVGLFRDLEADGRFRRDSRLSGILYPGKISFREVSRTNSLHIVLEGNRVSVHVDRFSPLAVGAPKVRCPYSLLAIVLHNIATVVANISRLLVGRRGRHRLQLECDWVWVDDHGIEAVPSGDRDENAAAAFEAMETGADAHSGVASGSSSLLRVPFSVVDEAVLLLDAEAAPWSIQLEARVAGRLDEHRLRSAVAEALRRHPMARARKVASRRSEHLNYWEIPDEPDWDPLRVVECPDDEALSAVRAELYSLAVPLAESPPLRVRLVRHPGGDLVMLSVHHAATDGFGCLRVMRSIARTYANAADPLPEIDFLAARDLRASLAADLSIRARRRLVLVDKLRDLVAPPARLAPDQPTARPGYGFHHVSLSAEQTQALLALEHPGTLNDVLVAALHLAVARWNAQHHRACRRIGVLVPVNLRPPEWQHEVVGNFSLPTRLTTNSRERATPATALAVVTAKTRRKKGAGMGSALIELLSASPLLPIWAKQVLVTLIPVTGNRLVDTAILSNLGRIDDPPSFGPEAGDITELWFSAPARMPLGLSLGAVTITGRLHLSFRYRHALFGPDAARRFVADYVAQLDHFTARKSSGS